MAVEARLDPASRQPTARSRWAGLLVEIAMAAVVAVRIAERGSAAEGIVLAIPYFGFFALIWWLLGKWFSMVLAFQVLPLGISGMVHAAGVDLGPVAPAFLQSALVPLALVGFVAGRMDRILASPLTAVDTGTVAPPARVLDGLVSSGFRSEPDHLYRAGTLPRVAAVFVHPRTPVVAEVVVQPVSPNHEPQTEIVSVLEGGGVLETRNVCQTPAGTARLRQVFPGAGVVELLKRHHEALAWLEDQGIEAMSVDLAGYRADLDRRLDDTARSVRAHPLRNAARALLLMLRRRHLDEGPVQDQAATAARIEALRAGGSGAPGTG